MLRYVRSTSITRGTSAGSASIMISSMQSVSTLCPELNAEGLPMPSRDSHVLLLIHRHCVKIRMNCAVIDRMTLHLTDQHIVLAATLHLHFHQSGGPAVAQC